MGIFALCEAIAIEVIDEVVQITILIGTVQLYVDARGCFTLNSRFGSGRDLAAVCRTARRAA